MVGKSEGERKRNRERRKMDKKMGGRYMSESDTYIEKKNWRKRKHEQREREREKERESWKEGKMD